MNKKDNLLIVVDMQNDFIDGALANQEAKETIPYIMDQIAKCDKVIFTKDTHYENYLDTQEGKKLPIKHCLRDSHGWEITSELMEAAVKNDKPFSVLIKETFGYTDWVSNTDLSEYENITLVGTCTDICVVSNALIIKAFYPEKNVIVISKCCSGTTVENHNHALKVMSSCQIDVK